jgi:hypothetical protein
MIRHCDKNGSQWPCGKASTTTSSLAASVRNYLKVTIVFLKLGPFGRSNRTRYGRPAEDGGEPRLR